MSQDANPPDQAEADQNTPPAEGDANVVVVLGADTPSVSTTTTTAVN